MTTLLWPKYYILLSQTTVDLDSQATPNQVKSGQHCKPESITFFFFKKQAKYSSYPLCNRALQPTPPIVLITTSAEVAAFNVSPRSH